MYDSPLSTEFVADRIHLVSASTRRHLASPSSPLQDDPTTGYMVRTLKEGWLQGCIILTTFTTWLPVDNFAWESGATGTLAADLQAAHRDGDRAPEVDGTGTGLGVGLRSGRGCE